MIMFCIGVVSFYQLNFCQLMAFSDQVSLLKSVQRELFNYIFRIFSKFLPSVVSQSPTSRWSPRLTALQQKLPSKAEPLHHSCPNFYITRKTLQGLEWNSALYATYTERTSEGVSLRFVRYTFCSLSSYCMSVSVATAQSSLAHINRISGQS